jgi:hypothetical protein
MSRATALAAALLIASGVRAQSISGAGAERLREIRGIRFLPEQCYRVRDLFLEREDFKLHFSDGYMLFAEPVHGKSMAALFLAATDTGSGEIILMPPTASERQSLARFLGEPVLSESMRTAMMFFTDDTAETLRRAMAENEFNRPDPDAGKMLAANWQTVARNLITGYETRLLMDSLAPRSPAAGFFAAAISGARAGRFDILLDPRRAEPISVGQAVWRDGRRYYDIWTSFRPRSFRGQPDKSGPPASDPARLEHYRIEATLAEDLSMKVTARATLVAGDPEDRAIPFELSAQMKLSRLLLDGRPIEFLQNEALDSSAARRSGNDWVLAVLDRPLPPGSRHEIEFQYEGNVITDAGQGVYFVGARGSWYPSRGPRFTDFDLLFHYPKRLQMVATGRMLETSVAGEVRTTRWKPEAPIRLAGFNLGNFERTTLHVRDYTVEVCANRNLEAALQPPLRPAPEPFPNLPSSRRPPLRPPLAAPPVPEPPPDPPPRRLEEVRRDSAGALDFFIQCFGPLPLHNLTISPIPADFGQGFPGLVYLSTLSYYQPEDRPLEKLNPQVRLFYSEQLRAHEIAHQWWGNLVTASDYHDEWLMESLAEYSALLFLEQHKGPRVLEQVLERYKANLLAKTDSGETVESSGAIALGERLRTSKSPRAHQVITYEKGAWVLHMLRGLMGDGKFFAFLSELRRRYEYKAVSTGQFRELAARFVPPVPQDPGLETFFSEWVYSTGIPKLQMEYRVTGRLPRYKVAGVIKQSGVAEDFSIPLTIEIQTPGRGGRAEMRVPTATPEARFSMTLPQRPTRIVMDPHDRVLAIKQ